MESWVTDVISAPMTVLMSAGGWGHECLRGQCRREAPERVDGGFGQEPGNAWFRTTVMRRRLHHCPAVDPFVGCHILHWSLFSQILGFDQKKNSHQKTKNKLIIHCQRGCGEIDSRN